MSTLAAAACVRGLDVPAVFRARSTLHDIGLHSVAVLVSVGDMTAIACITFTGLVRTCSVALGEYTKIPEYV